MAEFRLLGAMEVEAGGELLDPGPPKQRLVLAALLLDAGRPVSAGTLVDRLWDDEPPVDARGVIYAHVSRLRRLVARVAALDGTRLRIDRRSGGYLLDADRETVDAHRFRSLLDQARAAEPEGVLPTLRGALRLWRGAPLADLPGDWAARMRETLLRTHLGALVRWAELELSHPDHHAITDELYSLVNQYPFDERLAALLVRALSADGREAEALQTFARVRRHLRDELGVEPGAELRQAQASIVRADPGAVRSATGSVTATPRAVRPAQLPAVPGGFVGRGAELRRLDDLLTGRPGLTGRGPEMPMAVLSGTAGVGKTALALRWAHLARDQFRDGQLYVNLRAYGPDRPVTPLEALAGFLRALDVPAPEAAPPADLDEAAARYRSLLDGRRVLVLLDNAGSEEQVRPLLPGTPGCAVLITGRDQLPGLASRDGARRIDLDLLPPDDALGLLQGLAGDRVLAEPEAARRLVQLCARLPLALRLASELLAVRPNALLSGLVAELSVQGRRLDLLDTGSDGGTGMRAAFSGTYLRLPPDAARALRLIGLHPGHDLDRYAVAALAAVDVMDAQRLLDTLVRAGVLRHRPGGRQVMHGLLRAYARERAHDDAEADRRAAVTRLLDYYGRTAATATELLATPGPCRRARMPAAVSTPAAVSAPPAVSAPAARSGPGFAEPAAAARWLTTEMRNLAAAARYAAEEGWPEQANGLTAALRRTAAWPLPGDGSGRSAAVQLVGAATSRRLPPLARRPPSD